MWDSFRALAGITILTIVSMGHAASAQNLGSRIDAYLAAQVEGNGIPGVSACAVPDVALLYEGSFGVRRWRQQGALSVRPGRDLAIP